MQLDILGAPAKRKMWPHPLPRPSPRLRTRFLYYKTVEKTTKKNGCMITVKEINKLGLLNHISGYRGQVEIKDSKF